MISWTRVQRKLQAMPHRLAWTTRRLFHAYAVDGVDDRAATLAYYFVFSLFPFLVFLTTLLAYVPEIGPATMGLVTRLRAWMPASAMAVIEEQFETLVATPRPQLLTIGLIMAVFSASRGVDALRRALNLAARTGETRPWWQTQVMVIAITFATGILLMLMGLALLLGSEVGRWLGEHVPQWVGRPLHAIAHNRWVEYLAQWGWLRWPVTAVSMLLLSALSYRFLPARRTSLVEVLPGSIATAVAWLLVTYGFAVYVDTVSTYNVMYGSLGGVIVLMVWAYLSALIYLLGAELNVLRLRGNR